MTEAHKGDARENPLTEGEIVAAALRLIKQDGVEGLSMRRLSKELGRSHMAMYYWVPDKAALLDLVASAALRDIPVPKDASLGWAARLRELIGSIDEQLRANPGLGGILLDRMLSTDRRILNAAMDILVDAGFDDADVLMAYATVHTYLFGRYQLVTAPPPAVRAGGGRHGGQAGDPAPDAEWARLLRVRRGHPDRRTARSPRGPCAGVRSALRGSCPPGWGRRRRAPRTSLAAPGA